jgi:hypothetical protein
MHGVGFLTAWIDEISKVGYANPKGIDIGGMEVATAAIITIETLRLID